MCSYNFLMITWDETKRAANLAKHGVDFPAVASFEWETALHMQDDRFEYGETRFVAVGFIGPRLHVLVYAAPGADLRVISLRKANKREIANYVRNI